MEEHGEALRNVATQLPHEQLGRAIAIAKGRLPRTREGGLPPMATLKSRDERELRRLVGGVLRSTGDSDRCSGTKKAVRSIVEAGVKVQQVAHKLTEHIEGEAEKAMHEAHKVRHLAKHWRRVAVEGGPARQAALSDVGRAEQLALWEIERDAREGRTPIEVAEAQVATISAESKVTDVVAGSSLVGYWLQCARTGHLRRREHAYWEWKIIAMVRMWRVRAALRVRRREWWGAGRVRAADHVATSMYQVATGHDPTTHELRRTCMLDEPVADTDELIAMEAAAYRKWEAGGGWRGERARRKRWAAAAEARRVMEEARRREEEARRFKEYLRQGDRGAIRGLSGAVVQSDGSGGVYLELTKAKARKKPRPEQKSKRPASVVQYEEGVAPNRWGFWRVERVVEVRWRGGRTRQSTAQTLEARIRWHGLNPQTGLPWRDEWVGVEARNDEGRPMLNAALKKEAIELEAVKYGLRAPQRPRGQKRPATTPATEQQAGKRIKWRSALRGERREEMEREAVGGSKAVQRARRRSVRIREEEAEETEESAKCRHTAEAWADIRRQRLRTRAGKRRRRRDAVVESDAESEDEQGAVAEGGTREEGDDASPAGDSGRVQSDVQPSV